VTSELAPASDNGAKGHPRAVAAGGVRPGAARGLSVLVVALALLAGACRPSAKAAHPEPLGEWYVVQQDETLAEIARRAGVPEGDLLEVNGLKSGAEVVPGKMIFVLNGPGSHPDAGPTAGPAGAVSAADGSPPADAAHRPAARFRWPVDAPRVTSLFGSRWGRAHEGIDLQAAIGTPVYAADAGEVVYAGNTVRGYGNMVVVKHADALMTVYAHNSVLLVKVGQHVSSGQRIALSGQSGHATGPHVHFEVRRDQVPRDPLQFLPGRSTKQ
jgi:murein DD-endopeptidase MepM/ murein hydrolase activator NlpD